jgi:hypothetical protein
MDMQKIVDVLDIELQVTERLYMCYDSYMREEYESAMSDQFYYLYAVDKFETAMDELTSDEFTQYVGLREFELEFLNV